MLLVRLPYLWHIYFYFSFEFCRIKAHIHALDPNRCYHIESPSQDRFIGFNEAGTERSHQIADVSTDYLCSKPFFCEAFFNKSKSTLQHFQKDIQDI